MMTDKEKLEKLRVLDLVLDMAVDKEDVLIKGYTKHALEEIEECNESWCDSCPIIKHTGKLCCDYID